MQSTKKTSLGSVRVPTWTRSAHALDALAVGITRTKVNWIVDADIAGFFDAVSHEWLMRFVEHRIGDRRINRLVRKWLKAGVMEDGELVSAEAGTPQGAVASPLLALSAFRHYVMDLWRRALQRRSQRDRSTWERIAHLAREFLPQARILHPWPSERFAVKYPRWEPGA